MDAVIVAGAGMTRLRSRRGPFGSSPARRSSTRSRTLRLDVGALEAAYVGNAVAGLVTGQEMIRGQVILRPLGIEGIPIFNIENACASSSSALHLAWQGVACGAARRGAVPRGREADARRQVWMAAIGTAVDVESQVTSDEPSGAGGRAPSRSVFVDIYAQMARDYMALSGATARDFAEVVVKNQHNGRAQPARAVRRRADGRGGARQPPGGDAADLADVLADLDGAAAVILVSGRAARRHGTRGPAHSCVRRALRK